MNLLAHLEGLPFVALVADPANSADSGARTLIGAAVTLAVIALVIGIGVMMGRRQQG
jgi:hypothetical protein